LEEILELKLEQFVVSMLQDVAVQQGIPGPSYNHSRQARLKNRAPKKENIDNQQKKDRENILLEAPSVLR